MTDAGDESNVGQVGNKSASGPVRDAVALPAAMALGSLVLAVISLVSLAPADDIGLFDHSEDVVGIRLPGPHAHQISVGVRFIVAAIALRLAVVAARRIFRRNPDEGADRSTQTLTGAGVLVAAVAVTLNGLAVISALANTSSIYGVYNHIGS